MSSLREAVDDAARDIREWIGLARSQRVWFAHNSEVGLDMWPCPDEAGIRVSKVICDNLLSAVKEAEEQLELWKWAAENGFYAQESLIMGSPPWDCRDIDGELLATGDTPEDALRRARSAINGLMEGQIERNERDGGAT